MQLAACPTTAHPVVPDSASQIVSQPNQSAYLRLKLSLSLNLRRQVFLAVCDNLALRNRLAAQLYVDLAYPNDRPSAIPPFSPPAAMGTNGKLPLEANGTAAASTPCPRLVSLTLSLREPNPIDQVAQWLAKYSSKEISRPYAPPAFQILGIEHLTRQPAYVQQRFLHHLQQIAPAVHSLDSTLLLWLTRPWFHVLQQSAPAFWNSHTALFEFEGDPTPARSHKASSISTIDHPVSAPVQSPQKRRVGDHGDRRSDVDSDHSLQADPAAATPAATSRVQDEAAQTLAAHSSLDAGDRPDAAAVPQQAMLQGENVWDILTQDLAQLQDDSADPLPPDLASFTAPPAASVVPAAIEATQATQTPPTSDSQIADSEITDLIRAQPTVPLSGNLAAEVPEDTPGPIEAALVESTVRTADASLLPSLLLQIQPSLNLAELVRHAVGQTAEATPGRKSQAIQLLQQIEQLQQQRVTAPLAEAYQALGNLFRDRIEQGDTSELVLVIAILAYEQTLTWLEAASPLWSDILNDIGNLYWMMSRQSPASELALPYLEQGLAVYQLALTQTDPETRPHTYAMIQNNLGSAYGDLARYRDPAETLQQSVLAYEQALRYRRADDDPARHAATQNNLGTAYWNLAQHQQPVLRLQQAIAAYHEALRYYSQDRDPLHYAMIQNNLGTTYWNLAQHPQPKSANGATSGSEAAALLLQAIEAYRSALRYRTLEVSPPAHAATQNNLGTAYWHLATQPDTLASDRKEYLQEAILAYKAALAAVHYLKVAGTSHAPALTFDIFATHNNMGLAYYHLAMDKHDRPAEAQRSSYLEFALTYHLQALQGWEQQPDFYQTAFSHVLQAVRAFYSEFGMKGQNLALSKIPATLLPELMKRL